MRISTYLAAVLLTGSALALAACGTDEGGAAAADDDPQQKAQDAALAYSRCMRDHGVDVPDPEPGERGIRLMAPKGVAPEKMKAADEACRKHLEDIKPPELSEEQQKELQEAALAHARCMREHGIDMPDPTFGSSGEARIRIGPGSGVDPDDPEFKEAEEACRDKLPQLRGEGPDTERSP
jgi:hypothetical protein